MMIKRSSLLILALFSTTLSFSSISLADKKIPCTWGTSQNECGADSYCSFSLTGSYCTTPIIDETKKLVLNGDTNNTEQDNNSNQKVIIENMTVNQYGDDIEYPNGNNGNSENENGNNTENSAEEYADEYYDHDEPARYDRHYDDHKARQAGAVRRNR